MRFALDEAAQALREAAAGLLTVGLPAGDAWHKLVSAGVTGTLVAEADGGLGLDENALVPLLEEIGYSGLPVPAVETIAVAAPLLSRSLEPAELVTALLDGGSLVPFGQVAARFVLPDGNSLRLYEREILRLEPCVTVDATRQVVRLVEQPMGGVLLTDDPAEVRRAWRRGVLGTAAVLTGLARRLVDMTVTYVKGREQFGVPIGSFQAVKHALADAHVAVEFARPLVLAAGWAQAAGAADAGLLTSAAKVRAADAARLVARTAIQCHGAMGYTTEYDLHLFAKRVWALAPAWGDPAHHRARIAEEIGAANG